jgi:hypothetical protein
MLISSGGASSTTLGNFFAEFPVPLRTEPTALEQTGTANQYMIAIPGLNAFACSGVPVFIASTTNKTFGVQATVSSGLTAQGFLILRTDNTNGAPAYLAWSAEL